MRVRLALNGLRLALWVLALCLGGLDNQGGDGEALQPENCLGFAHAAKRQSPAADARFVGLR